MLELRGISLRSTDENGAAEILKDINLVLDSNRLYAFTGPNGGGKSSLAKVIMGIFQPDTGKIIFNGQDITNLGITERAKLGIGYAFQQPPRFKGLTVRELLNISSGRQDDKKTYRHLLDVGLCPRDYLDREINASLSGGEIKRIEIASLLSRKLRLAIYDEPEAGIDLWSFEQLSKVFKSIHQQNNLTTVIISHQERILTLADEIILIANGQIKEKGNKELIWPVIMDEVACKCRINCEERKDLEVEYY